MNSQEILQLFDDGCTWGQIRQQAKIGWVRMKKILKQNGRNVSFKERNATMKIVRRGIPAEQKKQILQLFDEGHPRQVIEKRLGISETAVRRVLSRANRSFFHRHKSKVSSPTKEQKQMIHRLVSEGHSQKTMAKQLGLTRWAVQCEMKVAGKSVNKQQNAISSGIDRGRIVADDESGSCSSKLSSAPTTTTSVENHIICTANIPKRSVRRKEHPEPEGEDSDSDREDTVESTVAGNLLASFDNFFGGAYHLSSIANKSGIPLDTVRQTLLFGSKKPSVETVQPLRTSSPESTTSVVSETAKECCQSNTKETFRQSNIKDSSCRFRCCICDLSWDDRDHFLSHLLAEKHRNMTELGVLLTCTGCRFRSRQPLKMGRHIIAYQADGRSDCETSVHSVTTVSTEEP